MPSMSAGPFAGLASPYATASALTDARAGLRPAGNTAVIIGDSIAAANSNGNLGRIGDMWFNHVCVESLQRMRYAGYYATAGYTLAQIAATHLPTVLALDPAPAACVIAGGTNDVGQAGSWSFTSSQASLESMVSQLRAANIVPILVLIPPRGDSATVNQNVMKWNAYIDTYAAASGLPVADMHTPVLNITDGGFLSGYDIGDHIHPSQKAHRAIGQYQVTRGLHEIFPPSRPLTAKWADPYNLITTGYGLFNVDTNADGTADGWTATNGSGSTLSRVTPSAADDLSGKWQQVSRPNTAVSNLYLQRLSITGWSVGDVLQFSCRVQSESVETTAGEWSAYVFFTGAAASESFISMYTWNSDVTDGLVYGELAVPANTTAVNVTLQVNPIVSGGPVICRFGEVTLRNLTTMGLI